MARPFAPNAQLRPRDDTLYVSQGRSVMATQRDGFIHDGKEHGFFCYETRFLSQYEVRINGEPVTPNLLSNVEQHTWLGYYTFWSNSLGLETLDDTGSGGMSPESEWPLEITLSRYVGDGIHEDLDVTNYTGKKLSFELELSIDADFADQAETGGKRQQKGKLGRFWGASGDRFDLRFHYEAENRFEHQDFKGHARIERGMRASFFNFDSTPEEVEKSGGKRIVFRIELEPRESWHTCIDFVPEIENQELKPRYQCHSFSQIKSEYDELRHLFTEESTHALDPSLPYLAPVVIGALEQAKHDMSTLRLFDLDRGKRSWTMAAGLPLYTSFFGRDTLTASWQAGLLGPEMMKGTLGVLGDTQGREVVNWFDEEPGRMIHEIHKGPLAELFFNNHGRNYGSVTTAHLYPFMLTQLWHWTGSRETVEPFLAPALRALKWMETHGDRDGDGFYEYHTNSEDGVKNQGWKDSPDGVVDENGEQISPPIAMCEEQGFAYASKSFFAEMLWSLGHRSEAKKIFHEARELKKRFNEKFWLEDKGFFAMGLGPKGEPIRSIGSDPGHCIATGIIDTSLIDRVANRLMEPDLFSGWGIRTLSTENPSFNPYSYHRGSVWPVENGTFCFGFMRYGLDEHLHRLSKAFFESASLFESYRLPEVYSGHARDLDHPVPALYPMANSPQAWSSSAVFNIVQALLGIYPYAPMKTLVINPTLPEWLPRIQLNGIRVGEASVSIFFFRKANGESDYEIVDKRGDLRVIRQPSPWSLTAGLGERLGDLKDSMLR